MPTHAAGATLVAQLGAMTMNTHSRSPRHAVAALALLLAAAAATAQEPTFGGEDMKRAWSDKELVGQGTNGARFFMSFKADGSASFANPAINDNGQWRATDTGYCATWSRIRQGKEACFVVRRSGSNFIVYTEDGSESGRILAVR